MSTRTTLHDYGAQVLREDLVACRVEVDVASADEPPLPHRAIVVHKAIPMPIVHFETNLGTVFFEQNVYSLGQLARSLRVHGKERELQHMYVRPLTTEFCLENEGKVAHTSNHVHLHPLARPQYVIDT